MRSIANRETVEGKGVGLREALCRQQSLDPFDLSGEIETILRGFFVGQPARHLREDQTVIFERPRVPQRVRRHAARRRQHDLHFLAHFVGVEIGRLATRTVAEFEPGLFVMMKKVCHGRDNI